MEEALSQFSSKIITFAILIFVAYVAISLIIHKGLNNVITSPAARDGVIKISSVIVFGLIAMAVLTDK